MRRVGSGSAHDETTPPEIDTRRIVESSGARIAVSDTGNRGLPAVVLLHGLAGSAREWGPTEAAIADEWRVIRIDQRGHGDSTRRPRDVSRRAFVDDVVAVVQARVPGERVLLVGQSMGAHTAFMVAAARPDLVEGLVMLEGHVDGSERPDEAAELGRYFASWPLPFADERTARHFLGEDSIVDAWIADLEEGPDGLRPRFDADVMESVIAAVHEPRWAEWEQLRVPVLAVFGEKGMFSEQRRQELIRRNPRALRTDIPGAGHDAHLDAHDAWVATLRSGLRDLALRRAEEPGR